MADDDGAPAADRGAVECLVCPFCLGLAALRQARPEAFEHLLKAGAELLLAVRALLEPAAEPAPDGQAAAARPARPGGMQHIDVG